MKQESWRQKWRRLMIESGLFLPVQIDGHQSKARNDEFVGMPPDVSVTDLIKALKED